MISTEQPFVVSEAVWFARTQRGLTQTQLAQQLSVSRPQLANVEAGRSKPSVSLIEEIAVALGCRFCLDGTYWTVDLRSAA